MPNDKPPVTGTQQELSFDKLSPRDFERLCLWLVEREGYERAEHPGAAGGEQGRDVLAWREGQLWAFQCKRVRNFGPSDARREVEKLLGIPEAERPAGLVFVVTCDVSMKAREVARETWTGPLGPEFWTGTELDAKVKQHPDILAEFFQPTTPIAVSIHQLPPPILLVVRKNSMNCGRRSKRGVVPLSLAFAGWAASAKPPWPSSWLRN